MAPIARRTRSASKPASSERRHHRLSGEDGGAPAGRRRASARAPAGPPLVIVIEDDNDDDDDDGRGGGAGRCKAERRRRPVPDAASVVEGDSGLAPSSDRRGEILGSDSDLLGTEDTVELRAVPDSASEKEGLGCGDRSVSVEGMTSSTRDCSVSVEEMESASRDCSVSVQVIESASRDCSVSDEGMESSSRDRSESVEVTESSSRDRSGSVEVMESASRDCSGSLKGEGEATSSSSHKEAEDEGQAASRGNDQCCSDGDEAEAPGSNEDRGKKAALSHGSAGHGSSIAGRTRLQRGEQARVSYDSYFMKEEVDDSDDESDEVEEKIEEEQRDDGFLHSSYVLEDIVDDSEDEEQEEEEAEKKKDNGDDDTSQETENGETDDSETKLMEKEESDWEKDDGSGILSKRKKPPNNSKEKINEKEMTLTGRGEMAGENGDDPGVLLKKRKLGIDILVSPSSGKEKSINMGPISSESIGVAQRTRSHVNSTPNKKEKYGTIKSPYPVDEDEWESQSDSGSSSLGVADEEEEAVGGDDSTDVDVQEEEMVQEGLCRGEYKKRKRVHPPRGKSLYKFLLDMILNDHPEMLEELISPREKSTQVGVSSRNANEPRLIFGFSDEETEPVEKSEFEREIDELWADFEFAKEAISIGTCHVNEGQEDINFEADHSSLCSKGKHQLSLDEQIGYICKVCSTVVQEIKDVLPCWAPHSQKWSAMKSSTSEKSRLVLDDFCTTIEDESIKGSRGIVAETAWDLIPGVYETMYEHQREAFEFMWENLVGGIQLEQLKSGAKADDIGGCVISHAPGTGKTRLAIVFIQSYMTLFPECRPVIVAPSGMLLTWEKELKKWGVNFPFHVLNVNEYSGKEDFRARLMVQNERKTALWIRLVKLFSWDKGNSILGISYALFVRLTDECSGDDYSAKICKILLEKPGLLVLDEGHIPRNDQSKNWNALGKVKTGQRIILSGTPFQNNLAELHNTLRLVRPKFTKKIPAEILKLCQRKAELKSENELAERNEGKGNGTSQVNYIGDDKVKEFRSLIKPFVHVYNGEILKQLPGLKDCLVVLDPPLHQKRILGEMKLANIKTKTLEYEYKINLASVHPSLATFLPLSEDEKCLRLNPNAGAKTRFVIQLIRLCKPLEEKVIVFSQYLQSLAILRDQLVELFEWIDGKEVLWMDGKTPSVRRQSSIDTFNSLSSEARVLLASTKACSEGICLTGASRIVLLDIVWNPSVERQAISRAYRIGQKKVVYTYRLITFGTGEEEKCERQAKKNRMSKLVFSPKIHSENIPNNLSQAEDQRLSKLISEDKILFEMIGHEEFKDMFNKIYYPPVESNIMYTVS